MTEIARNTRTRAYILVKTQFENVGDALINRELIRKISERCPVTVDVSRAPEHFINALTEGAKSEVTVTRKGFPLLFLTMMANRLGGGRPVYFLVPGGNQGDKGFAKYLANRLYNQCLRLIHGLGIRLAYVGASYERLGPRYKKIVAERSRLLDVHLVRDQLTADYLNACGILYDGLIPDLAFGLSFDTDRLTNRPTSRAHGAIALSFRSDLPYTSHDSIKSFVKAIIHAFPGRRLKFISQVKRDTEFMKFLCRDCSEHGENEAIFEDLSESLQACHSAYADCDLMFSNRLHGLLLSLSAGVTPYPAIFSGKDSKIRGVFDSIGLVSNVIDIDKPYDLDRLRSLKSGISEQDVELITAASVKLDKTFDGILGPKAPGTTGSDAR